MHRTPSKDCYNKHLSVNKFMISLLINIFYGRGLKGHAGCRQADTQMNSRTFANGIGEQRDRETERQLPPTKNFFPLKRWLQLQFEQDSISIRARFDASCWHPKSYVNK